MAGRDPTPPPGLDPNSSLVEKGAESGTPGVVFTTLDNPNIHFEEPLQWVPRTERHLTFLTQQAVRSFSSDEFVFYDSDFTVLTSGGLAAPMKGNGGSLNVGSVNDVLFPWPNQAGYWAVNQGDGKVPFDTHAVRIGHKALTITLQQTLPDGTQRVGSLPFNVALDPKVALVPIEVIVPFTKNHPQLARRLAYQKLLWDLESTFSYNFTTYHDAAYAWEPPQPEISQVYRGWDNWVNRGSTTQHYLAKNAATPDSVFASCNIQFRLAHYVEFEAPDDSYVAPTNNDRLCGVDGNTAMLGVRDEAATRGLLIAGSPIDVVVMDRCTCPQYGGLNSAADARYNSGVVCAGPLAGLLDLSHELGHALGLCEGYFVPKDSNQCSYATVPGCAPGFGLMCAVPLEVTPTECDIARVKAMSFSSTVGW